MKCLQSALPLLLALGLAVPAFAQGSDSCATAQVIAGTGTFAFDNTAATTDGIPDPLCLAFSTDQIERDVWFAWTAPASGLYQLETCSLTGIDSKIAVLAGSCAGTVLACNDDTCALQSRVQFSASAGSPYLLRIGCYPGAAGGTGSFLLGVVPPPTVLDTRVNPANGRTYHLLGGGSWTVAQAAAVALGGNLATIRSQAEHDWIVQQWHNWLGVDVDLWIGLNDAAVEGQFVWASGEPVTYTNWDVGEPNNGAGIEDYTALRKNNPLAFWNDLADAPTGYHANPLAVVELPGTPLAAVCPGDGSGTACPCANHSPAGAGEGCLNSLGTGGRLGSTGAASVGSDTLVLRGSQMPSSSALYFQGSSTIGGGAVFGDGLRCAGGSVIRLGTKINVAGVSQYPAAGDPSVSVRGLCTAGATRTYQVWYRNAAAFCTASTFNLTNGLQATWTP